MSSDRKYDGLIGKKFGSLTVVELTKIGNITKWKCQCDCGEIRFLNGSVLIKERTRSCGCKKGFYSGIELDLKAQRFGKLTIIERAENGYKNTARWKYLCDCGQLGETTRAALTRYGQISCGCISKGKPNIKNRKATTPINTIWSLIKSSSIRRKISFELSKEDVMNLIFKNCYYCGSAPSNTLKNRSTKELTKYNGLDRVDNLLGYTLTNVVPCCWTCNDAKSNRNYQEFMLWIKSIYDRLNLSKMGV